MTPEELGIPASMRVVRAVGPVPQAVGWEVEYIGVPMDGKPDAVEWPWMKVRNRRGRVVELLQVWYLAMTHRDSGFRLERRWRPELGADYEWIATTKNGEFGMLGEARGLFRHAGRRPTVRGPEEIEAAHARLMRSIGKPPTAARLARELGCTTATLRNYLHRWSLDLPLS